MDFPSQRSPGVSEEELERLAATVVRHMVFRQNSRPGIPVKSDELSDLLKQQYPTVKGLLAHVLPLAKVLARERLGFEIADLGDRPGQTPPSSPERQQRQYAASGRLLVLQSTLEPEVLQKYVLTDGAAQRLALKLTVCTLIDASGKSLPEETLWKLLKRMGVPRQSNSHPAFGNVKETMQELVKEKIITLSKGHAEDGSEALCYGLGPKAFATFGKGDLKGYFEQICDGEHS